MGAPSPELCNLWLARAFNAQDVEAAAAMYHPEAAIVQVDEVHGDTRIARGAAGIRATMAAYVGLKPHMDVITHHTTVAGEFAMTRSQWLIRGRDQDGKPTEAVAQEPAPADKAVPNRPSVGAIQGAVGSVMAGARSCLAGQETGSKATVTFGADGHVKSVSVAGPAAGTPAEGCVRSALMGARVPPFSEPEYSASFTVRPP